LQVAALHRRRHHPTVRRGLTGGDGCGCIFDGRALAGC
jgi:hypothetical protein